MKIEKFNFEKFKDKILSNARDKKILFHCSPIGGLTELNQINLGHTKKELNPAFLHHIT